jgi:hypothetical protein
MTSIKYLILGSNGKYLQADRTFDNIIETAVAFVSLEEAKDYIEQYLPSDLYSVATYIVKL